MIACDRLLISNNNSGVIWNARQKLRCIYHCRSPHYLLVQIFLASELTHIHPLLVAHQYCCIYLYSNRWTNHDCEYIQTVVNTNKQCRYPSWWCHFLPMNIIVLYIPVTWLGCATYFWVFKNVLNYGYQ